MTDTHTGSESDHTEKSTKQTEEERDCMVKSETVADSDNTNTVIELLEKILRIDTDYLDRLFAIGMFAFFAVFIALTPRYTPNSRIFPLVNGIPAVVLLGGLLIMQFSDRLQNIIGNLPTTNPFEFDEKKQFKIADRSQESSIFGRRKNVLVISAWTLFLFILIMIVGFHLAIFVFLLGFYRFQTEQGWPNSVGYTLITWAAIYIVFEVLMNTELYRGMLEVVLFN